MSHRLDRHCIALKGILLANRLAGRTVEAVG
jgi:hypothetical protein